MQRRWAVWSLLLALSAGELVASADTKATKDPRPSLALITVTRGAGFAEQDMDTVEGLLLSALDRTRRFRVIGRSDIETMLSLEMRKQQLGCSDTACMTEIAGALGVDYVSAAEVGKLDGVTILNLKVIEVKTATVIVHARQTAANGELIRAIDTLVAEVANAVPGAAVAVPVPAAPVAAPPPVAIPAAAVPAVTRVEPKSQLEFVSLPGGGSVAPFWLGRTEVTVEAYAKCVTAGGCTQPDSGDFCTWSLAGHEKHPINCIDWKQAAAFCAWIGGRLPTEQEWQSEAEGGDGREYPWGDTRPSDALARFNTSEGTVPVGSYPQGTSRHGLLDMAGNVYEWTATSYDADGIVIRGAAWKTDDARKLRSTNRARRAPTDRRNTIGIRCAMSS